MNVKKFTANSSREVMRLVRETLGDDAVILSNRNVNGYIEILAVASEYMSSLTAPVFEKEALAAPMPKTLKPAPAPARPAAAAARPDILPAQVRAIADRYIASEPAAQPVEAKPVKKAVKKSAPPATRSTVSPEVVDTRLKHVMTELRSMRSMFESQLAEISWGSKQEREPLRADLMREMLTAGFSPGMARYLVENLPEHEKADGGMRWIQRALARNLVTVDSEDDLLDQGGVFALVGPTGVGKTTTTAKLAARFVMRHGAGKLALITTDGYRIGGFEQLRIYGKILGVMVHSVKDQADLRIALDELRGKHTVLIDTVGMSQRDRMVADQIAMLSNTGKDVKRLLCLAATSTGETLNEVVSAYKGNGLAGCIMTKIDEAATTGNLLDVIIRQKLTLYYVANGQRVPEDLEVADSHALIRHAFSMKKQSRAYTFDNDELPMVVAHSVQTMKKARAGGAGRG
ncbi:flagellar biosynthesis protein FlhF [Oxalobacter sp. OttesenSCG-928-P03]|nr:flagellar biosynthesis protein FlhF [Oxalobacter sp. OttesenSCG-928-P03]